MPHNRNDHDEDTARIGTLLAGVESYVNSQKTKILALRNPVFFVDVNTNPIFTLVYPFPTMGGRLKVPVDYTQHPHRELPNMLFTFVFDSVGYEGFLYFLPNGRLFPVIHAIIRDEAGMTRFRNISITLRRKVMQNPPSTSRSE
jgi:hypothetical protein